MSGRAGARLWRIEIKVPEAAARAFEAALERFVQSIAVMAAPENGLVSLEGVAEREPDRRALALALDLAAASALSAVPRPDVTPLADRDWVGAGLARQAPVFAGRYVVHGSHLDARRTVPSGRVGIVVDAGLAFGTGAHESTYGCLLALDRLARRRTRRRVRAALDMGCGTGVLAVAVARTWHCPVLACDIDPVAVRIARTSVAVNGLGGRIRVVRGDGYRARAVAAGAPYDLVSANILARPLRRMAPALAHSLAPGGVAVLSGFLEAQEAEVLAAHRAQGLRLVRRFAVGDWRTLVVRR